MKVQMNRVMATLQAESSSSTSFRHLVCWTALQSVVKESADEDVRDVSVQCSVLSEVTHSCKN